MKVSKINNWSFTTGLTLWQFCCILMVSWFFIGGRFTQVPIQHSLCKYQIFLWVTFKIPHLQTTMYDFVCYIKHQRPLLTRKVDFNYGESFCWQFYTARKLDLSKIYIHLLTCFHQGKKEKWMERQWLRFDKHDIGMMFENNCQNVINYYSPRCRRLEVDITKVIWYNYQRGTKKMILTNFLVTIIILLL